MNDKIDEKPQEIELPKLINDPCQSDSIVESGSRVEKDTLSNNDNIPPKFNDIDNNTEIRD